MNLNLKKIVVQLNTLLYIILHFLVQKCNYSYIADSKWFCKEGNINLRNIWPS